MKTMKKLTKFVYIDTNIFYHCRFFTEIDWKSIFKENVDKVVIRVPYMVMKELDKGKYKFKRARQVLPKLRELKDREIKNGVELEISLFPTKWESLDSEWKEKLDN
jgi:rRNA-processing protein FCF1